MSTFTVMNGTDSDPGSLRDGITQVNAGTFTTINFANGVTIVTLTSAELLITRSVTIENIFPQTVEILRDLTAANFRILNIDGTVNPPTVVSIIGFSSGFPITISQGINDVDNGGGINSISTTLELTDVIVTNCVSTNNNGGGIFHDAGPITLTRTIISQNNSSGGIGGGIFIGDSSLVTISNSDFVSNTATSAGGGIFISNSPSSTITNSIINGNNAFGGDGAGIDLSFSTLSITNSTISGNLAGTTGGGISSTDSSLTIIDSTISNNSATSLGGGGIYTDDILSTASLLSISNSTIYGNTTGGSGGAINIGNLLSIQATLINVTIPFNAAATAGGVFAGLAGIIIPIVISVGNTIIADNIGGPSDVAGNFTSLGHNLIGNGDGSTGFTNGVNGDQVGTEDSPINPLLDLPADNGGPTLTVALLVGSPAINAGDNALNPLGNIFDQRGSPFLRISPIGGIIDIGAFEFQQAVICYSGKSKILTKNILTGEINEINAENVIAETHEVYNITNECFVPVRLNIVTGLINRFMLIKKDAIGLNQPNEDFYVTSGHKLVIDGKEIKARDIQQAKRIKAKSQKVYSICIDKRCPIMVNGLSVMAWGYNEWMEYSRKRGISWSNNKKIKPNNNCYY